MFASLGLRTRNRLLSFVVKTCRRQKHCIATNLEAAEDPRMFQYGSMGQHNLSVVFVASFVTC